MIIGDECVSSNPIAQLSAGPRDKASGQSRLAAEHDRPLQVRRDNSHSRPLIVSKHLGLCLTGIAFAWPMR